MTKKGSRLASEPSDRHALARCSDELAGHSSADEDEAITVRTVIMTRVPRNMLSRVGRGRSFADHIAVLVEYLIGGSIRVPLMCDLCHDRDQLEGLEHAVGRKNLPALGALDLYDGICLSTQRSFLEPVSSAFGGQHSIAWASCLSLPHAA
jgi:hypothetical protein